MAPRIVCQIAALERCRRVWVVEEDWESRQYRTVDAPTHGLPEFQDLSVVGLVCAETMAGRANVHTRLEFDRSVKWREVSIRHARAIARRTAERRGTVVHLALYDDPYRVVWEPVGCL